MLCQECGQHPATLHFTKIISGEKSEFHICEHCAREKGEVLQGVNSSSFSIHNLLSGLLNFEAPNNGSMNKQTAQGLRCSSCGLTYAQFSRSGRFGCATCYQTFGERVEPIFRKVHSGNVSHHGKIPKRSGEKIYVRREVQELKEKLQEAINQEEFELAAQVRDKIRELEKKISASGG